MHILSSQGLVRVATSNVRPWGFLACLRCMFCVYDIGISLYTHNFARMLVFATAVGRRPQPPSRRGETVGDALGKEIDMGQIVRHTSPTTHEL